MDPDPKIAGGSPSDGTSVTIFPIPVPALNHSKPPKSTSDSCELSVATVIGSEKELVPIPLYAATSTS